MTKYRPGNNGTVIVTCSRDNYRPLIASVEGNIGCGNSTFLSHCDGRAVV